MNTALPIPTDSIHKFSCLFGLALIIVAIVSLNSNYNQSLERKIKSIEVIVALESKANKTKADEDTISLNKQLVDVTKKNEDLASKLLGGTAGIGALFCFFGAKQWYGKIQKRDDELAQLQIDKLKAEITKLQMPSAQNGNSATTPGATPP